MAWNNTDEFLNLYYITIEHGLKAISGDSKFPPEIAQTYIAKRMTKVTCKKQRLIPLGMHAVASHVCIISKKKKKETCKQAFSAFLG